MQEIRIMGITTKDLANICNVSRTTVHRALHGTGRINPETKKKILEVAEQYGYRPDMLARGLVKGKTFQIGVVIMDVNNRYFSQMLSEIETAARQEGYFVNVTMHEQNPELEKEQLLRLVDYHVDGIILSSINGGTEYKKFLQELETPVVTIDNRVDAGIPFVASDGYRAIQEAMADIMSRGYERIAFVCPPLADARKTNIYTHQERLAAYQDAMARKGKAPIVFSDWDYLEKTEKYLRSSGKKTAFLCTGDMIALDMIEYLKLRELEAGKDYGIMGFDNIDFLKYVSPRLTTIDNSVKQVANAAVELLFQLINKEENVNTERILGFRIVEGETL